MGKAGRVFWVMVVAQVLSCTADSGADPVSATLQSLICSPTFTPTFRQTTSANEWWAEYTVSGPGVQAVWLEVGGRTVNLQPQWGKWVGSTGARVPRGTQVRLHARNNLNQTASTQPFAYLVNTSPATEPCGVCVPSCSDRACGDDGCGGTCGSCAANQACDAGVCTCVPRCGTAVCGSDGCGGICGTCPANQACDAGSCTSTCVPQCGAAVCGSDGCGGTCGACPPGQACTAGACTSACVAPWDPAWQVLTSSNAWWVEATISGGTLASAAFEVVGRGRMSLTYQWGKWSGSTGAQVPAGTQVILHATNSLGQTARTEPFAWLREWTPQTDPCGGSGAPSACPPLATGLVTVALDDGWEAQYTLARPELLERGLKGSFFLITNRVGQGWTGYLTMPQARQLVAEGHEIGSHSVTHRDMTTLTEQESDDELRQSKQWLQTNLGVTAEHFVTPFGAYDQRVVAAAKRHYESHGTVESGLNFPGDDAYRLKRVPVLSTTTPSEIRTLLQQARAERGWVILLFHKFTTSTPTASDDYRVSDFEQVLDDIVASGLPVVTVEQGVTQTRCP